MKFKALANVATSIDGKDTIVEVGQVIEVDSEQGQKLLEYPYFFEQIEEETEVAEEKPKTKPRKKKESDE